MISVSVCAAEHILYADTSFDTALWEQKMLPIVYLQEWVVSEYHMRILK